MYAGRKLFVFGVVLTSVICFVPGSAGQTLPAPPQATVDTTYPTQTGLTINVAAGGDFQGALDRAQLGDTILLQSGATFTGTFTLRAKSGTGWIVVRTSAPDTSLPPVGARITPAYAGIMPKIISPSSLPAVQTAAGAHHYRFVGVEFTIATGLAINYGVVALGDGSNLQNTSSQVPFSLILDRVYIHGRAGVNVRRGVALNSGSAAVVDSYIAELHESGGDSQAICGWNGPGPYKITNNYLEAASENILFGGSDPSIANLVPSDIEVRGNYVNKPVAWMNTPWNIKNLLELKNARRVLIDGNIFEHNWPGAQNGFSILFTVRNQNGTAVWSTIEDVTFTHNIVRHVASAVNILGSDTDFPSQQTKRVLIKDNVFDDVNAVTWGGNGILLQMLKGTANVTFNHNTANHTGNVIMADVPPPNSGFTYTNNISPHNLYGVIGAGTAPGTSTLNTWFPGAPFVKNVLAGGPAASYPANNFFPASMSVVGFTDLAGSNYKLLATSPYKNGGTDGKDIGADLDAVNAATINVISGNGGPPPPPPVDVTPPVLSITNPAAGASVSATTMIAANATDNVGVAGVQFFVDTAALGAEVTAPPYQVSWNTTTTTNGAHTLSAIARDGAGNRGSATVVSVTVANPVPDTTPPAVSITSPASLASVSATISISANATDNIGVVGVQFFVDTAPLGAEVTAPPYQVSWNTTTLTNGAHTLSATARDAAGNRGSAPVVSVTVANPVPDTTPPAVAITSPASLASVSATISLSANATDNIGVAGVQFLVDAMAVGSEDTAAPYQISWDTTRATNGSHVLTAVARDAAGNRMTSASVTVTVANTLPPVPRSPFTGTPFVIPGRFEAEDFDKGGEGVAYHEMVAGNQGGLYRTTEDVDIISPYAGGYVVNNFQTGEWMEYSINVTQSGTYRVEALVSSQFTTSRFHVSVDGVDKTGAITVPNTGLWTTFQWVGKDGVSLTAGQHILRLTTDSEYFNVDALRLTLTAIARPFSGTPFVVPGQFEAEDFDRGGEGVAYHDVLAGNQGGLYRLTEDVDIISPYVGGYVVNNFQTGEWMEYSINVAQSGTYKVETLVSSQFTTSRFHVSVDGIDMTGPVTPPNTGSWFTFQWVGKDGVNLTAGPHILRLTSDVEYFNVDALRISATVVVPAPADTTPPSVAISSPAGGATVAGTTMITASASDDTLVAGVVFFVDGGVADTEKMFAPYQTSWDTTRTTNGSHTLTALVRDAAGNTTTSAAVTVIVANSVPDQTPPTVAITSPLSGASVSGVTAIGASASDNVGVAGVQFLVDGTPAGVEVTTTPYATSWSSAAVANGSHTLTAVARDAAGNQTTSAPVTVTVANSAPVAPDTTPPTVVITNPSGTVSGSVTISASASDDVGVVAVQFFVDGSPAGSEKTSPPYQVSWDTTTAANGSHTLTAVARDAAGNRGTSSTISVTVSNAVAPPPSTQRSPFNASPAVVPGVVEAEDFDRGGEGVAYHDVTPGNQGGDYRLSEDVDIINPYPLGYAITNVRTGEWLEYTVNVMASGTYRMDAMLSCESGAARFHIELDRVDVTGSMKAPNTGWLGRYQLMSKSGVSMTAGQHVLRIYVDTESFNLDSITFTLEASSGRSRVAR